MTTANSISFPPPGERTQEGGFFIVSLQGTWREMGRQYGKLLQAELQQVLDFAKQRATPETDGYLMPHGIPLGIDFLDQFFLGMSEGSGLAPKELVTINGIEVAYATDYVQQNGLTPAGPCSALALFGDKTTEGQMLYGRNYDWLSSFSHLPLVLARFQPQGSDLAFTSLNYAGCLYLTTGMNSAGLFLELNSGLYASEEINRRTIHNSWLLWHVLFNAKNAVQGVRLLDSLRAQSCYVIGLADARETFSYEWGVSASAALQTPASEGMLAMSNHFVQPGWKNRPEAYQGGCESSVSRRNALLSLAGKIAPGTGTIDTLKEIMDVPVQNGGAKCQATLFQVLAVPESQELHIRTSRNPHWVTLCSPER